MLESPDVDPVEVVVVIPHHLPSLDFLHEWNALRSPEVKIIVMEDKLARETTVPPGFDNVAVYTHADVEAEFEEDAWVIPRTSSACRSYGYLKAWQLNPKYIITLDNDCYPDGSSFVEGHVMNLERNVSLDWFDTLPDYPVYARGFPYEIREQSPVFLSHGLWSHVPDLDAATSLHNRSLRTEPATQSIVVPRHNFFPMCGMNLAWRAELTPALYFGLFGPTYGFDQYDDIWAGVLVKKVLDHLGYAAITGYPSVEHRKQSNVYVNLMKQAPGMGMNEVFWREVAKINLTSTTVLDSYIELINKLPSVMQPEVPGWLEKFKTAALLWCGHFK